MPPLKHKTLLQLEAATQAKKIPPEVVASLFHQVVPDVLERFRELARDRLLDALLSVARTHLNSLEWVHGMEFMVWKAVTDGAQRLSEDEVDEFKELAEEAGGWFYRFGDIDDYDPSQVTDEQAKPAFLPIDTWNEYYAKYDAAHGTPEDANLRLRRKIGELEEQTKRKDRQIEELESLLNEKFKEEDKEKPIE